MKDLANCFGMYHVFIQYHTTPELFLIFHIKRPAVLGPHGRQDSVQVVILVLKQLRQIPLQLHFLVLPAPVRVMNPAAAVAVHLHQ